MSISRPQSGSARYGRSMAAAATAVVLVASTALAHDTWIIPDLVAFAANATMHMQAAMALDMPRSGIRSIAVAAAPTIEPRCSMASSDAAKA